MTVSNLWPLGFLVLIPVIILLYLLKQKVKDQPFSSTMLWREIYKNLEAKTPFEKLKQNILMYLQILAMLLLILALMAPVLKNGGFVKHNVVLVIDNSASMDYLYEGDRTRLSESIARAKRYLDGVNESSSVTLISCSDEATVIYQGEDKSAAKRRLSEIQAAYVPGTLNQSTTTVQSVLANLDNVDVVCYTDSEFDISGWKRTNENASITVENVYNAGENCAVDYVNYTLRGDEIEAICKVTNYGSADVTQDVSLYGEGTLLDVQTVTVAAGSSEVVYFTKTVLPAALTAEGMVLKAELSGKDQLNADNSQGIVVTAAGEKRILLLSKGNVFLEKALSLAEGAEVYKSDDPGVLSQAEAFDLYVFDGVELPEGITLPDDTDGAQSTAEKPKALGSSALLFLNYETAPLGMDYLAGSGAVSDAMLYFSASDVTRYVEDYSFGITGSYTYQLPEWAVPVIKTEDGEIAGYYGTLHDARISVLGFDIHNSDFALQTEFPIFMSQLTEYLLNSSGENRELFNFPTAAESDVIPVSALEVSGIYDKTKTGGRALRNILLVLALLVLAIEWYIYHIQVHSNKKKQYLVVRGLVALLVLLAMAGLSVSRRMRRVETIFLVDVSDSMSGNKESLSEYLKQKFSTMPKKNQAGVVLFGGNTAVEQFLSEQNQFYGFTAAPVTTATNIENAVTSACALFDDGVTKRLVLITDGCENEGSMSLAAAGVKGSDVELSVIAMEDSIGANGEVYIDGLETPAVIHAGDHYNITVSIRSNVETDALLSLYSGRVSKGQQEIHLNKGVNQFLFEDVGEEGTIAQYKAVIEPEQDTIAANNTYVTFSQIEARPKVLLVEGIPGKAEEFEKILAAANIDYDKVTGSGVPVSLSQLNAYKAVITLDVHYDDLRSGFAKTLETYVKDYAGGYICIGGDSSYALGNYRDTELEEILPVNVDLAGEKEIPKMAMVMVIDQSGSMTAPSEENTSVTGLDLAKQAAVAGVNELRETDEAGVLAFDDTYNWTVPITTASDKDALKEKIRTIGAGGGTSIYPALEEAYAKLLNSDAKLKHIILLTDGQDSFQEYDVLLDRINAAGITVSTVAVGSGSDQNMLGWVAETCGGRFYYTDINNSIPRIFAQEVYLSTNTYLINEEFYPAITSGNEMLNGVMDEGCPALLGYIAATAKQRAEVVLQSPNGDPILSTWQCGLGRTIAWNSDGTNEWTAAFASWENYPMLWSNMIHYVISDTDLSGDNLEIEKEGNSTRVVYETEEYDQNTGVSVVVTDENGDSKELKLDPEKPGTFSTSIDAADIGIYNLSLRKSQGEEIVKNYNTAYANQYSMEYRFSDSEGELTQFVRQTDGEMLTLLDDIWKVDTEKKNVKTPITVFLLVAAVFLFLFDIIIRRFSLDVAGDIKRFFERNVGSVREGLKAFKKSSADRVSEERKDGGRLRRSEEDLQQIREATGNDKRAENAVVSENEKIYDRKTDQKASKTEAQAKTGSGQTSTEKLDMNALLKKKQDRS